MLYGTIALWQDDRGFGFIKPDNENVEIFVHISAFGKNCKRPEQGDRVCFESTIEQSGKQKAKFARVIENEFVDINKSRPVTVIRKKSAHHNYNMRQKSRRPYQLILLMLICVIALISFISKTFTTPQNSSPSLNKNTENYPPEDQQRFTCSGKVYCSEMSSYEEAVFYLNHCPGVKMDGDGDGKPCETQFSK